MRPLFLLFLLSSFCSAQSVKVRAVNGNNGHALPNQEVAVQFFYDKPASVTPPLRLRTNSEGEAEFTIPSPAPDHMDVRLSPPSKYWNCDCWVQKDTATVLHDGILSSFPKKKVLPGIVSKPEEITFVATPYSVVERLLSRIPGD